MHILMLSKHISFIHIHALLATELKSIKNLTIVVIIYNGLQISVKLH